MFKENFKAAFGFITGIAAGCYVVEFVDNLIKQAKKQYKEENKQQEEKSKADVWEESVK